MPISQYSDELPTEKTMQILSYGDKMYLAGNAGAGGTTISVYNVSSGITSFRGWLVIDPYTDECEIRKVRSVNDTTLTISALSYSHDINNVVLLIPNPIINVTWFGVDANTGTADNSTAFARAIAQVSDTNELNIVEIPPGTFNFTSSLSLGNKPITIRGSGEKYTKLKFNGCNGLTYDAGTAGTGGSFHLNLEDFLVEGNWTASTTGISIEQAVYLDMRRIRVQYFTTYGIYLYFIIGGMMNNCVVRDNDGDGLYFDGVVNVFQLISCAITNNNGWGAILTSKENNMDNPNHQPSFITCVFEDNREGGMLVDYTTSLSLLNNYFADNKNANTTPSGRGSFSAPTIGYNLRVGSDSVANQSSRSFIISGNLFSDVYGSTNEGYHLTLDEIVGCRVEANQFVRGAGNYTEAIVHDGANTQNVVVTPDNYYSNDARATFGSSTMNGTTGREIAHKLQNDGDGAYRVMVTPTASVDGRVYITKDDLKFTVYSTDAGDSGAFDWMIMQES